MIDTLFCKIRLRHLLPSLLLMFSATSCSDGYGTYSTKYPVLFSMSINYSSQLFNTMAGMGQFVTIRKTVENVNGNMQSVITVSGPTGTDYCAIDRISEDFLYGLGGLIVGNNIYGEPMAYDLACPNCDRASRRLSIDDTGMAKCGHCGLVYDLNNYGAISTASSSAGGDLRGLYRYRISYNGTVVTVSN